MNPRPFSYSNDDDDDEGSSSSPYVTVDHDDCSHLPKRQQYRQKMMQLQTLLHCMTTEPNHPTSSYSWRSLVMRAQRCESLWQTVLALYRDFSLSEEEEDKIEDPFPGWAPKVDQACRQAHELATFLKQKEERATPDLIDQIFFLDKEEEEKNENGEEEEGPYDGLLDEEEEPQNEDPNSKHHQDASPSKQSRPISMDDFQQEQREQMEEAIAMMAARMKEATQGIQSQLQQQTKSTLNELETVAEQNMVDVTQVTQNVKQHHQKQRKQSWGTWTLLILIAGVFVSCLLTIFTIPKRADTCLIFCGGTTSMSLVGWFFRPVTIVAHKTIPPLWKVLQKQFGTGADDHWDDVSQQDSWEDYYDEDEMERREKEKLDKLLNSLQSGSGRNKKDTDEWRTAVSDDQENDGDYGGDYNEEDHEDNGYEENDYDYEEEQYDETEQQEDHSENLYEDERGDEYTKQDYYDEGQNDDEAEPQDMEEEQEEYVNEMQEDEIYDDEEGGDHCGDKEENYQQQEEHDQVDPEDVHDQIQVDEVNGEKGNDNYSYKEDDDDEQEEHDQMRMQDLEEEQKDVQDGILEDELFDGEKAEIEGVEKSVGGSKLELDKRKDSKEDGDDPFSRYETTKKVLPKDDGDQDLFASKEPVKKQAGEDPGFGGQKPIAKAAEIRPDGTMDIAAETDDGAKSKRPESAHDVNMADLLASLNQAAQRTKEVDPIKEEEEALKKKHSKSIFGDDSYHPHHPSTGEEDLDVAKLRVTPKDIRTAADTGNFEKLQSWLELQPEYVDRQDKNQWTALHLAARSGNTEAVKILFQHGASLMIQNNRKKIPLDEAVAHLGNNHPTTELLQRLEATGSIDEVEDIESSISEDDKTSEIEDSESSGSEDDETSEIEDSESSVSEGNEDSDIEDNEDGAESRQGPVDIRFLLDEKEDEDFESYIAMGRSKLDVIETSLSKMRPVLALEEPEQLDDYIQAGRSRLEAVLESKRFKDEL